jgi:hypothetical protein
MRENPKVGPEKALKALDNKDSKPYNDLIEKAIAFNRRTEAPNPYAYDFLKHIENPDAEPANVAPEAESFNPEEFTPPGEPAAAPAPQQNVPRGTIPPIEIAQRGGILPGMEQHVAEQNAGAARVAGEGLTSEANRPKDISQAAGRMETMSPLFRGTEASPQREIFGNAPNAPAPATTTPPVIEAALRDSGWTYEGKNNLGQYTIKEPGTNIKISLFERQLNEDFIRRKMAEKEKQFGVPQERNPGGAGGGRTETEVLHTFKDEENGIQVDVAKVSQGYSVSMKDVDAGETVPTVKIYKTEAQAVDAAQKLVKKR